MARKQRVLLLSESFGSGHTQAAHGLATLLRSHPIKLQTRVIELGSFMHPLLFPWVIRAYKKTVCKTPKLYDLVYKTPHEGTWQLLSAMALHRLFYHRTATLLHALRPDAIVCTHPFPNMVVSRLKRAGKIHTPLCTVITDYDVHGTWISQETNAYFVSDQEVRAQLLRYNIPDKTIRVTGMPVHPKFRTIQDRQKTAAHLHINDTLPTVLLMGGGWGLINDRHLQTILTTWADHIQFLVVFGHNAKNHAHWQQHPIATHPHVRLFGFTPHIDQLMEVADMLFTKPGGMTCAEAHAKSLPMLFHMSIPGQEIENARHFIERGYAKTYSSIDELHTVCADLIQNIVAHRAQRHLLRQLPPPTTPEETIDTILYLINDDASYSST